MRILRLDLQSGEELDLHPYVTVLGGLSADVQRRVLDRLVRLARGDAADVSGLVEAQGVLVEVDEAAVAALGLPADTDVVVRAEDLPGARLVDGDGAPNAVQASRDRLAVARSALAEVEAELAAASGRVESASAELDAARRGLDDFAVAAHDTAVARLAEAEAAAAASVAADPSEPVDERTRLEAQLAEAQAEAAQSEADLDLERLLLLEMLEDLESERGALAALRGDPEVASEVAVLAVDDGPAAPVVPAAEHVEAVGRALEVVRRGPPEAPLVESPEALELADRIAEHHGRHDALERDLRAEGIDVAGLQRQLLDAQLTAEQAEIDARPRIISPEEDAEIERLHDIVVEQGEKRSSRRGGKSAEAAYQEASDALDDILERVGHPTYAAYVMGRIAPAVDPAARRRHEEAVALVAALESQLDEAASVLERDARVLMLRAERDQLWAAARDLLGTLPDDVESALRSMRVVGEIEHTAVRDLAAVLASVDVAPAGPDEEAIVAAAERFLDDAARARAERDAFDAAAGAEPRPEPEIVDDPIVVAERRVADLHRDAARADAELTVHESAFEERLAAIASLTAAIDSLPTDGAPVPGLDPRIERDPRVVEARSQAQMTEARLGRHQAAVAQVDRSHALLSEARAAERAASGALDAAGAEVAAAESEVGELIDLAPLAEVEWHLDDGGVEPIEWYLLGRVSALRQISHAGSVPLILDDAFRGLPDVHVTALCGALARVGESVQVIYVGESPAVAAWAEAQGLDLAALVRPGQPAI